MSSYLWWTTINEEIDELLFMMNNYNEEIDELLFMMNNYKWRNRWTLIYDEQL